MGTEEGVGGLRGALMLLTRVPLSGGLSGSEEIARSVPWFPGVGTAIGLVVGGSYAIALLFLPDLVAAAVALTVGLGLTGALHEDGLGDVADGFWGGWEPDQRLQIMKDPKLGTFGVAAVVMSLILRVGTLASLSAISGVAVMVAAHSLSRGAVVAALMAKPKGEDGMAATYGRDVVPMTAVTGMVVGAIASGIAMGIWALPAMLLAALVMFGMSALARSKIGMVNGDVLGSIQQLSEISVLLLGAALVSRGISVTWLG